MSEARFYIGQIVRHCMFGYCGVIFDVDPVYRGTDDWYRQIALSRPPKDAPWYHVIVHDALHTTYVAERNLEPDPYPQQVAHPDLGKHFSAFDGTRYLKEHRGN